MLNPATVAAWSLDKSYIVDLDITGVRVPRTVRIEDGDLSSTLDRFGWDRAVLKPTIGADGDLVQLVDRDSAREFDDRGLPPGWSPWLVQEFVPAVGDHGETSVVVIDDRVAHAVVKRPAVGEWRVNSQFGPPPLERTEVALADSLVRSILEQLPERPLYARVDLVVGPDEIVLLEIETGDPKLWFSASPDSAPLMADAIERRLRAGLTDVV